MQQHFIYYHSISLLRLPAAEFVMPLTLALGAEFNQAARTPNMAAHTPAKVEDLLATLSGAKEEIRIPHHPLILLELLVLGVTVLRYDLSHLSFSGPYSAASLRAAEVVESVLVLY